MSDEHSNLPPASTSEDGVQDSSAAASVPAPPAPQGVQKGRFWVTEDRLVDEDGLAEQGFEGAPAVADNLSTGEGHVVMEGEAADMYSPEQPRSEIPPLEQGREVRKGRFVVTVTHEQDGESEDEPPGDAKPADETAVPVEDQQTAPVHVHENPGPGGEEHPHLNEQKKQAHQKKPANPVMRELQRISQQNHKLHRMLRVLAERKGIFEKDFASLQHPSTATGGSSGTGATSSLSTPAASSVSTTKVSVASAADTRKLQQLVVELQNGTSTLITEYDVLKSKNHLLSKQLKDVKQQLKEANEVINTLKTKVGQKEEKIEQLERAMAEH